MSDQGAVGGVTVRPSASADRSYEVLIGDAVLDRLPDMLADYAPDHRYALVTDDRVRGLHAERIREQLLEVGLAVDLLSFPGGEANKNRRAWAIISDEMVAAGCGRDTTVLAFGGGVVGDLAGFVAATYMRGLPVVQIPTTLLAMIDSSVGGKTGVDTSAGKNLIGVFHQPRLVVADVSLLRTLPLEQLRAGLAEAVKHGAIADAGYVEWIVSSADSLLAMETHALTRLITRSVEIKAEVVGRDERESGRRKILNFGHTIGHAAEAASGFTMLHGEAVSIGMVCEARLGERSGVTEPGTSSRLEDALRKLGLPTEVPADLSPERILELTALDKKSRAGVVEYALLEKLGAPARRQDGAWSHSVPDQLVLESLAP
jgi:3-dehydroquinate synthase